MHEMNEDGRDKDERSLPFAAEWTIELGVVGVNVLLVVGNVGPATRALKMQYEILYKAMKGRCIVTHDVIRLTLLRVVSSADHV